MPTPTSRKAGLSRIRRCGRLRIHALTRDAGVAEPARAPGDRLTGRPRAAARVPDALQAGAERAAAGRGVGEVAARDHVGGVVARRAGELAVGRQRGEAARAALGVDQAQHHAGPEPAGAVRAPAQPRASASGARRAGERERGDDERRRGGRSAADRRSRRRRSAARSPSAAARRSASTKPTRIEPDQRDHEDHVQRGDLPLPRSSRMTGRVLARPMPRPAASPRRGAARDFPPGTGGKPHPLIGLRC